MRALEPNDARTAAARLVDPVVLDGCALQCHSCTSICDATLAALLGATLVPLLHFGMIFVGTPYVQNPQIMTADAIGGSPYRPSTIAEPDAKRPVADVELLIARNLGVRPDRVASALRIVRVTTLQGREVDAPAYVTVGE
jgi:hypothetical protein